MGNEIHHPAAVSSHSLIVKYTVVHGQDLGSVTKICNELMDRPDECWQPLGGIAVAHCPMESTAKEGLPITVKVTDAVTTYAQAMVKLQQFSD